MRLRQLFEAMRARLDGRERDAATLCYLQGLSRAQAAARMGVSEARMRKLMDGAGAGRPRGRKQGRRSGGGDPRRSLVRGAGLADACPRLRHPRARR
jgi:transposase